MRSTKLTRITKSSMFAALDLARYACAGGIIASAVANLTFAPAVPGNAMCAAVGAVIAVWAARRWNLE